jgi:hypothetical protein
MRPTRRLAALPILAAAALGVTATHAEAATTGKIASRTLTVKGDGGDNRIALSATPDLVRVDNGDDGTIDMTFRRDKFERIVVRAGAGNDSVRIDESGGVFTDTEATTIQGEAGDDVLTGGSGPEVLDGGDGQDRVDPRRGNDTVLLGDGDDVTTWAPGDANDTIEGGRGQDVLHFDAANIGENIALSANAGRLRMTRDIGSVVMDAGALERVEIVARGGADTIAVGDLTGTGVTSVAPDLGGADGAADSVVVDGTAGADALHVGGTPGPVVTGGAATVSVANPEPGLDQVVLRGQGGDDTATVDGSAGDDTFAVTPDGARVRVDNIGAAPWAAELDSIEHLDVRGNGGADSITASNGLSTLVQLTADGGAGNDTITGGDGADVLRGGDGSDVITPGRGSDTAILGAGDDVARWNPGDGNDTIEGEGGADTLAFNGSAASENVALSANGARLRLARDIGAVTMDAAGVETVRYAALGGTDVLSVGDLAGTGVTDVDGDLAGTLGGTVGDGVPDNVLVAGTDGDDAIAVTGTPGDIAVAGLATRVHIGHADATDLLAIDTRAGTDTVDSSGLAPGAIQLSVG